MFYTIQKGDTLAKIAAGYGTTVDKLMELNPQISSRDLIFTGHSLRLPDQPYPGTVVESSANERADEVEDVPQLQSSSTAAKHSEDAVINAGEKTGEVVAKAVKTKAQTDKEIITAQPRFIAGVARGVVQHFSKTTSNSVPSQDDKVVSAGEKTGEVLVKAIKIKAQIDKEIITAQPRFIMGAVKGFFNKLLGE